MGDVGGAGMAQWAAMYGGNGGGAAADQAVSSPTSGGSGGGGSPTHVAAQQPGIEGGRVGKPARRRSRASRRAPVTLLNTDTSNFRAMVQQFTGIPSGPYSVPGAPSVGGGGGPVISFGASSGDYGVGGGAMPVRPSPTSAVMSFDHLQLHRPQQQSHQLFRPQQQQQYGYGGNGGDMFMHGFESSSAEDRLLLQSIQAAQMLPRPAASAAHNTSGYNFG